MFYLRGFKTHALTFLKLKTKRKDSINPITTPNLGSDYNIYKLITCVVSLHLSELANAFVCSFPGHWFISNLCKSTSTTTTPLKGEQMMTVILVLITGGPHV